MSKLVVNPNPGSNFSFGAGLGMAIEVQKTSPGALPISAGRDAPRAFVLVNRVELEFIGKQRNEKVQV